MTIFRNLKNQSAFNHASRISIKQFKIFFLRHSALYLIIKKKHACIIKMDKKRLKIALSVLDAVRNRFPETNEFIDSTLKEECEKERITADEVIFYKFKSKKLA